MDENIGLTLKKTDTPLKKSDKTVERKFFDPNDGCLDISNFLEHPFGFVPLVVPITEPTVGYGAALSLIFIKENKPTPEGKRVNPDISAIGGFGTENGTKGSFALHSGNWFDGKLQTLAILADTSANLDFYGSGNQGLRYNLETQLIKLEALYRLGNSRSMLGLGYIYGAMNTHFKSTALPPDMTFANRESHLGGLSLLYNYDSRDNFFTPNRGFMADLATTFHDPSFGASSSYQKVELNTFYYHPLHENLIFGIRGSVHMSFGEVPFYQRPYIVLRGAPVMRYQGEHVAFSEAELRWKIMNRVSLIGFAGLGVTSDHFRDVQWSNNIVTGGLGIRYELARKQGLHMGVDVGFSEEGPALYIVFGNAWLRP
jgi:hypothetical protein